MTTATLTKQDRCDADAHGSEAAVALVYVVPGSQPLHLCGHHLRKAQPAITERGYRVEVLDSTFA